MKQLIFVYNAESGLSNALLDTGRRIFQPKDYPCALCMVTYGPFGMKSDWKSFTKQLPYDVSFYHKDELPKELSLQATTFPCLILKDGNTSHTLINGNEFSKIQDLETLKKRVLEVIK